MLRLFWHIFLFLMLYGLFSYAYGQNNPGGPIEDENFIRHVIEEGIKPPIFGSNSYNPVKQIFEPCYNDVNGGVHQQFETDANKVPITDKPLTKRMTKSRSISTHMHHFVDFSIGFTTTKKCLSSSKKPTTTAASTTKVTYPKVFTTRKCVKNNKNSEPTIQFFKESKFTTSKYTQKSTIPWWRTSSRTKRTFTTTTACPFTDDLTTKARYTTTRCKITSRRTTYRYTNDNWRTSTRNWRTTTIHNRNTNNWQTSSSARPTSRFWSRTTRCKSTARTTRDWRTTTPNWRTTTTPKCRTTTTPNWRTTTTRNWRTTTTRTSRTNTPCRKKTTTTRIWRTTTTPTYTGVPDGGDGGGDGGDGGTGGPDGGNDGGGPNGPDGGKGDDDGGGPNGPDGGNGDNDGGGPNGPDDGNGGDGGNGDNDGGGPNGPDDGNGGDGGDGSNTGPGGGGGDSGDAKTTFTIIKKKKTTTTFTLVISSEEDDWWAKKKKRFKRIGNNITVALRTPVIVQGRAQKIEISMPKALNESELSIKDPLPITEMTISVTSEPAVKTTKKDIPNNKVMNRIPLSNWWSRRQAPNRRAFLGPLL